MRLSAGKTNCFVSKGTKKQGGGHRNARGWGFKGVLSRPCKWPSIERKNRVWGLSYNFWEVLKTLSLRA